METFIGTLAGTLFGGLISFLISRFYYKKGLKKKTLSCYVQYISEILTDIDPEVKQRLVIDFEGRKVDSLYQVQFIIANTGDLPIRDVIRPLTLEVPNAGEVLDANVVYIEPNGREVGQQTLRTGENNFVEFTFPLLNSGDYFVVKLLVKGSAPLPDDNEGADDDESLIDFLEFKRYNLFKFKIAADDLPSVIVSERLPNDYSDFESSYLDKSMLTVFIVFVIFSIVYGYVLLSLDGGLFLFNFSKFFADFSFLKFCIILGWLLVFFQLIAAIVLLFGEFSLFKSKKKGLKFKLPRKLDEFHEL